MKKVVIIGAGLAGLSTAYYLENNYKVSNYKIFEKDFRVGGLCKSESVNGFTFDYTGHLLHLHNDYTKKLIITLLGKNIKKIKRNSWIYSKGVYTPYPFQANLYGLPHSVIKECITGFIKAMYENDEKHPETFEEWIYKYLGDGIAKHFMIPYNRKLWTVHPRELSCEWLGKYVPHPFLEEVLDGALQPQKKDFGYNVYFYYPIRGGIGSLPMAFAQHIRNIQLSKKVVGMDTHNKIAKIGGEREVYDVLVSTIPLPELIKIINDIPNSVENACRKLRYASVYNVNLGVKRQQISDKHWIYFPEEEFIFYRIGFMSNFSPYMSPKGMSSIYAEISHSKNRPINKKNILERVIEDLTKCDILKPTDEIVTKCILDIKYGYVLYDKSYRKSIDVIHNYLKDNNIYSNGRYGGWEYSTMEDAILAGKKLADRIRSDH